MFLRRTYIMNKAMIESYLRNLFGVVLALVVTAMTNAGVSSPVELTTGDWLTVANGLWAAAVPTLLRYVNKKDPAFGRIAKVAVAEVSKKLDETAKAEKAKKPAAKKTTTKKAAPKK